MPISGTVSLQYKGVVTDVRCYRNHSERTKAVNHFKKKAKGLFEVYLIFCPNVEDIKLKSKAKRAYDIAVFKPKINNNG